MDTNQTVRCSNCGSLAQRYYYTDEVCGDRQIIRTECRVCDYLMVMCSSGNVIEAYAPGITALTGNLNSSQKSSFKELWKQLLPKTHQLPTSVI